MKKERVNYNQSTLFLQYNFLKNYASGTGPPKLIGGIIGS